MRTTFLDPELDAALDRDGYVVVPLIDRDGVERLTKAYESLGVAPGDPQRACVDTFHCFDAEYKQAVHDEVESVLRPAVQAIFDRYKSLSYCYIQKWPGERSGFGIHQDISVLDESEARSVEVWCALTDTSEVNGQLWVVPGSHRWAPDVVRGIHCHPPAYAGLEERILARHAIPVPMKAGEAIIFCHATYHFSYTNESGTFRLVAATDMIPEEARHLHYVENDQGTITEYEIDESFWVDQNPFTMLRAPANLTRIREIDPSTFTRLTDEDLDRFVEEGMAIEHEPLPVAPINPDLKWCHRCGTTDGVEGHVNRFNGNVTLLCPNCDAAQARMAGVIGDIDPVLLEALDRDGYAVVDLLDASDTHRARSLATSLRFDVDAPFFIMNRDAPRADAVRVDWALREVVQPAVDRRLPGFRVVKSVVINKGPRHGAAVDLHQDWEYVDERYHRGYGVFCPLDEAGPHEGGIHVIPGSHRWRDDHRGSGFDDPFSDVKDEIIERGSVAVPLEAGQALIYDNALLHHSTPNRSARPRTVVASVIVPPQAPVIHLHSTDARTAEVFEIPASSDHFTGATFGSRPAGAPTRVVDIAVPKVTTEEVERWLPHGRSPRPATRVSPPTTAEPVAPADPAPTAPTAASAAAASASTVPTVPTVPTIPTTPVAPGSPGVAGVFGAAFRALRRRAQGPPHR